MKKIANLIALLVVMAPSLVMAQGATCADMDPICTDVGANFTANTGTTSEAGNDYGCLATQPNPSWYYFEVATNGNIDMSLTAPSDIDFIIWGPYADLTAAQADCGSLGGNEVDCSYSSTNNETPSIPNAVAGEVYIMLITNYANITQDISLTQTGGTGSTDCSIVNNPPCFMSFMNATISACDPATDTYEVTGQIDFEDPPTTGDLVVEDCYGNTVVVASAPFTVNAQNEGVENYILSGLLPDGLACDVTGYFTADPTCSINITYTAPICICTFTGWDYNIGICDDVTNTFDITGSVSFESAPSTGTLTIVDCNGNSDVYAAPFTSPQTFTLAGITPNGTTNCAITATFSDDPTCTITTSTFNHPANCSCTVDAGSFTASVVGSTNSTYELCFGDVLTITPNGDFNPPPDIGDDGTFSYDPGMWFLIYDCPPTLQAPDNIFTDPCLLGVWEDTQPFGPWDIDNVYGNNTTYYFVPVTFYDYVVGVFSYYWAGLPSCFDMGPAYPVTFLEPIITNTNEDCFAGTATITFNGGAPAFDGSNFNIVPGSLLPTTAVFDNTDCTEGGTITISGLVDGDVYSFDVVDDKNCPVTVTGTFVGMEDATFNYDFKYCQDDPDPLPTITGVPGGNFTVTPAGLNFVNTTTGLIDLSSSTPGVYTVQYESPALNCWGTETFTLSIYALPVVTATEDSPICDDGISIINLNEIGGDVDLWSWTSNGTATYDFDTIQGPIVTGAVDGEIFTVTGENSNSGCISTDQIAVTVNPIEDATFTLTNFCIGTANSATVTGTTGGTFAFNPAPGDGATIDGVTGEISNEVAGTTYSVEYITPGVCFASSIETVSVYDLPTIQTTDVSVCLGGNVDITATGGDSYLWSPATYLNTMVGSTVNSTPLADIVYTVTGTDANGCQNTAASSVTVAGNAPINAGNDVTICDGDNTTLAATGGITYNWDSGLGVGNNFVVSPSVTTTYTVDGTDASGCSGTDQVTIIVNPIPTVDPVVDQVICNTDATASINFTGSAGTVFDWVNNDASIGLGSSGTGDITSFNVTNAGLTPVIATISVTPTANGCVGAVEDFTITVNPTPNVDPIADETVCNGDPTAAVNFTGGVVGTTFDWVNNNPTIGLVANGTGSIAPFNGLNAGTTPISGTITVTPTANGCFGSTESFILTINPTPIVDPTLDEVLCNGTSSTAVNFTSSTAGTTYTWTNDSPTIGLAANGNGNIASFSALNNGATPIIATISVTPTANGCVGLPVEYTITVNPTPSVDPIADEVVCAGENTSAVNFSGAVAGTTYDWVNSNATIGLSSNGNGNIASFTGVNGGITPIFGTITVTPTANTCVGLTESFDITINPLPTATIAGNATVCEGDPSPVITFTGASGVSPYTFTYNINGVGTTTVTSVGNAATLNVPTTPTGTYNYNLVSVQDASGTACSQTQTGTATIVVNPNPVPVINGATEYCAGTTSTLSTSVPFNTYAWSTGDVTPTADVTTADNPITVNVTNAFGCSGTSSVFNVIENTVLVYNSQIEICQGESVNIHGNMESVAGVYSQTFILGTGCDSTANVTLVVNPLPVINAGVNQFECEGTDITLNATGAPTIDWDVLNVDNGIAFSQPVGTVTYTATGTDANGCQNTSVVDVTIHPTPTVDPIIDQTLCDGALTSAVNFNGSVAGTTFTWTNDNANIGLAVIGSGDIGIFNGTNNNASPIAGTIEVTPSANGCDGLTETFVISVNPTPTMASLVDQTLCNNAATTAVNFVSATPGATFSWINNNTAIGLAANGNGNIASFNAANATANPISGLITVSPSANGCTGLNETITFTVNPTPVADPIADEVVCNNALTTPVAFTSATAGTTFAWSNNNTNIGLAANGTGNISAFNATNNTSSPIAAAITVTPSAHSCVGNSITYNITVNPSPAIDPIADQSVCNGSGTTLVGFTSSTPGTTFTWSNDNAAIGLAANGNGNIASFIGTNAGSSPIAGLITATPNANGCDGSTESFVITIDPSPAVDPVVSQTLCTGANTASVNFSSPTVGTSFSWINDNPTIGLAAGGNGNIASFLAVNNTSNQISGTISVTPTVNGCIGTPVDFVINVDPAPSIDPLDNIEICEGEATPSVAFTSSNASAVFAWNNDNTSIGLVATGAGNIASFNGVNGGASSLVGTITVVPTANSCVGNSETFTITVNPLPAVFAGNDLTVCEGEQVVLTGSGAIDYIWDNGVADGDAFEAVDGIYNVIGTDVNGCVNTDDVLITVEPFPQPSFDVSVPSCEPFTVTLTNTTPGAVDNCIWSINDGSSPINGCGPIEYTFSSAGSYDVTLTTTSALGCEASVTYTDIIYLENSPIASFTASEYNLTNLSTQVSFTNTSINASSYTWSFGDESQSTSTTNPAHVFPSETEGSYVVTLVATSSMGCVDTAYATITIDEEVIFYVPNSFTPDDDDYNETFKPIFTSGFDPYNYTLLIFNRWGEIIFESHDVSVGWDATYAGSNDVQDGTYTWKIIFKTLATDERKEVMGHVNVLR
ncbi:MAG: gliding motility-associated C-terminal domain-containing protein [Crocinitomicaceae bacterium]|nr:gliding motility-associated C-terminal domain-containing protein [Crocinitomicaceae bacterium]